MLAVFDNPRETIEFCNLVHEALGRGMRVRLDLSAVEKVRSDALLLLRAVMDDTRGSGGSVGGNLPRYPPAAAKFKHSGFFQGFERPPTDMPEPKGLIRRKQSKRVDSEIAAELVEFAQRHAELSKEGADAANKNLIELMLNTHNHAANEKGTRRWEAIVYCTGGVAYFTFVDLGVGILRSSAPKGYLKRLKQTILDVGEVELLRQVFQGKIGASAEIPGRGFGLTTMVNAAAAGRLPELRIMTSSVSGRVADLDFHEIDTKVTGTIYQWQSRPRAKQ